MKILLVCALLIVDAFAAKGVNELCALSDDQVSAVVNCMGDHVSSKIKTEVKEYITEHGGNIVKTLKNLCETNVDFDDLINRLASPEAVEAINKAYTECQQS